MASASAAVNDLRSLNVKLSALKEH
jgi:hypothetical protein